MKVHLLTSAQLVNKQNTISVATFTCWCLLVHLLTSVQLVNIKAAQFTHSLQFSW